jgi:hypothetical protein
MGKTTEMTLDEIAPEDPAARQAEPPIVEAADALPLHSTELRAAIHSSLGPKAAAVLYWERPVHSGASLAALLLLLVGLRFYTLTHILCTFVAGHFLVSMLSNVFSRRLPDSDIRQMMDRMRVDESSERARGIFCAIVSIVNVLIKWYFSVILGRDKLGCSVMFALIAVVWVLPRVPPCHIRRIIALAKGEAMLLIGARAGLIEIPDGPFLPHARRRPLLRVAERVRDKPRGLRRVPGQRPRQGAPSTLCE